MAVMKWTTVDGEKMPLMEKKIRDQIRRCEIDIKEKKEWKEKQYKELIEKAQDRYIGMWMAQIGEEIEKTESEIYQLGVKKHMLEYFLNDEMEA